jgi:nucleotide-binding universal stress UspA family protein
MPPQVTFLGVVLALVFALSMSGLLWWMLHPPAQIKLAVAKARRSFGAIKTILVPTSGAPYSERGIELACRLGIEQKAQIVLTYVIEVPRTLPLNASMDEAEKVANEALTRGQEIVELHNLIPVLQLERAREAGEGIIKVAQDKEADLIVLGMRSNLKGTTTIWGRTTDTLLRKSPCEVIIDKLPSES